MIRYRDLRVSPEERKSYIQEVNKTLKNGRLIDGYQIEALEEKVAKYCWRDYAIAVNSGTSAILLALQLLKLKKGDEVIVPCMGVVPMVNPMLLLEIKPVFVDVAYDYNINPHKIKDKLTKNTKAVMGVNYTGKICRIDEIKRICYKHDLLFIEDASQSFGAKYRNNPSGSFGDVSVASMNAMKIFGSCGEAGMIMVNDIYFADRLRKMRYNGLIDKQISDYVSLNSRMNTLQAIFLLNRFKYLKKDIERRREIAEIYNNRLQGNHSTTSDDNHSYCVYFTYNVQCDDRDKLYDYLAKKGIETQKRDSVLLPHQLPNRKEYKSLEFPFGDSISKESISLPIHNKLKDEDIFYICDTIDDFYGR